MRRDAVLFYRTDKLRDDLELDEKVIEAILSRLESVERRLRATQVWCEVKGLSAGDTVFFVEGEGQAWEHHIPAVVDTVDGDLATVTLNHGFPHQRIVRIEELELRVPDA